MHTCEIALQRPRLFLALQHRATENLAVRQFLLMYHSRPKASAPVCETHHNTYTLIGIETALLLYDGQPLAAT
jgi:hypothetical protein